MSRPVLLALDTATRITAAALRLPDGEWLLDESEESARSRMLAPMLESLLRRAGLDWRDIDRLAWAHGPGSFTGLRIGAATLAGLNAGFDRPCADISSLAITARQASAGAEISVIEDARAGQAFIGRFDADARPLQPDACISLDELARLPAGRFAACQPPEPMPAGWERLPAQRPRAQALAEAASCLDDACFAAASPFPAPLYLQPSQAERLAHA